MRRWLWFLVVVSTACSSSTPLPQITEEGSIAPDTSVLVSTTTANGDTALATDDARSEERNELVDTYIAARDIEDPIVVQAMREVPRHHFVPADLAEQAYRDSALPIGHGQTISQPYIVALMSELCGVKPGDTVLEVGTGSGYQAAVLAEMGVKVFSICHCWAISTCDDQKPTASPAR